MDVESYYEIARTAEFIHSHSYTRVALQFPDELLKDSRLVVRALRDRLRSLKGCGADQNEDRKDIRLFVMADTTYGSCCVDEVGALHVNAEFVIHYGHTCLSPTTSLPAFFVFGKASINAEDCVEKISNYALTIGKRILVLYGLEYSYAMKNVREALGDALKLSGSKSELAVDLADVMSSVTNPSADTRSSNGLVGSAADSTDNKTSVMAPSSSFSIGGLTWTLPDGHKMEDYLVFWIGSENSAFANVVLTFNSCDIVRYDATENCLVTDVSQQKRILKRRYFLVEKAKDANIVGILVGTLGVAGYQHMINQMKELVTAAGKKAYTLVMGKPNPAKLANFPECDVFVYVSCAQTALLDSKEYLAPVITPFEAMLAFSRGSQWTGEYLMEFRDLIGSCPLEGQQLEEARFSFFSGGYVEDLDLQGENDKEDNEGALALANATEKVLQLRDNPKCLTKGTARSGPEYFASRSYQGLEMQHNSSLSESYLPGRSGRASGYRDEKDRKDES